MTWQQSRRNEGQSQSQSGRPSPSVASASANVSVSVSVTRDRDRDTDRGRDIDIDTPSPGNANANATSSSNNNNNNNNNAANFNTNIHLPSKQHRLAGGSASAPASASASASASPPPGRPAHLQQQHSSHSHSRSHSSSSRDLKNLENSRGWQVNRTMAARRANRQEGEEVALWKSTQSDIKTVVADINASNENTRQIAAIETRLATVQDSKDPDDSQLHTDLLHQLDTLYRAGVKLNDAVVKKMGDVKEALMIVKALAQAKEDDAKGPAPGPSSRSSASFHAGGSAGGRSSSRAGKLDKERGRAERAERAERERELLERERERERERDREQRERETYRERERERDKDRDRDREASREANNNHNSNSSSSSSNNNDKDAKDIKDKQDHLYDFDGAAERSPRPSPIPGTHARKLGVRVGASSGGPSSSDRSGPGNRDSVPPRDTPSKAGSVEPGAGVVGSSATRAKVVFVENQDVAFKPKSSETGEWFLGKVKRVTGEGKGRRYIVKDEDPDLPETERREFKMSASGMISIPSPSGKAESALPKLDKGKMVLALYPDSTTFYKAEVMGMDAATGSVALRFEGEEQSGTQQMVDRRFVVDYRE
ncbi:unnamed protein product [Discula destructiva]